MRYNFRKCGGVINTVNKVLEHNPTHVDWKQSGGSGEWRQASFIKSDKGWLVILRYKEEGPIYSTLEEAVVGHIKTLYDQTEKECYWMDYKASNYYDKPGGSLLIQR